MNDPTLHRLSPSAQRLLLAATLLLAAPAAATACGAPPAAVTAPADDPDSGVELIGRPARAWTFTRWLRTKPLSQESLRGKVVLLRWWNLDCHYCEQTLPEIDRLRRTYGPKGLVVIGVFHPKPVRHVRDAVILAAAQERHFGGPIAVDERWQTLERWWLEGKPERNWTSVSFLMDQNGVVRWVHGGGEYHASSDPRHAVCARKAEGLEREIRRLLGEETALR